jgi:hypothetical protein
VITHKDRIIGYLSAHPGGADDDQLATVTGITPRQAVNRVCRALAEAGVITRGKPQPGDKITNRLADEALAASSAPAVESAPEPAAPRPAVDLANVRIVGQVVALPDTSAVAAFAYPGDTGLPEDVVKKAVQACRGQAGIHHFTRQTGERRPDPDARQALRRAWSQAGMSRKAWRARGGIRFFSVMVTTNPQCEDRGFSDSPQHCA